LRLIRIEFEEAQLGLEKARRLSERWSHGPAWPTPRCPDIDKQWDFVTPGMEIKLGCIDLERNGGEQTPSALSALRLTSRSVSGDAVNLATVATDNMTAAFHSIPNLLLPI
jgi:hypothetical protein